MAPGWCVPVSHSAGVVVWKLFAEKYGERTASGDRDVDHPGVGEEGHLDVDAAAQGLAILVLVASMA